jgi:methylglutamate dehydrogenase subunit B
MLRITCPFCGERDYSEFRYFRYGGDASRPRPAHGSGDAKTWHDYVFVFDNPKGPHTEYWQHVLGCRQWLILGRNTATNEVGTSRPARIRSGGEKR